MKAPTFHERVCVCVGGRGLPVERCGWQLLQFDHLLVGRVAGAPERAVSRLDDEERVHVRVVRRVVHVVRQVRAGNSR